MLRELRGFGGGDVNVPVNLLTSCMLRDLRGFGGGYADDVALIMGWGGVEC